MKTYQELSKAELKSTLQILEMRYNELKSRNLALDMTRGKPSPDQLSIANDMPSMLDTNALFAEDGSDCRNYGVPYGLKECRNLFGEILGIDPELVTVGNNSSLQLMYDTLSRSLIYGEIESEKPWGQIPNRKWLCPVPGYDRHFLVTETLGFELIPVPLHEDGPDMDMVEKLVAEDATILGMWGMPLYSNPDGYVYSEEVCKRLVSMKTAAPDFRIMWDNAYVVHHLYDDVANQGTLPDILKLAREAGNPNRVYEFASTSKITFAGSGIACMAANEENVARARKVLNVQSIGPNKVIQLMHAKYVPNLDAVKSIMSKQADILRPKFEKVLRVLKDEFEGSGVARWNNPKGGYFVSIYVMDGTAKETVKLAKECGVAFTPAGATYPYGKDPSDSNIRIAPSFPKIDDIEVAVTVLSVCAKLAAVRKLLEE
ncbi:MAG: aminotransferase class I/II-fold pyridoxal phosphate-dependent enzyme [Clostridiales bacterium]|nr:aminotransferase class I/II-fold pyridoxal phosphate-dependent enzyme [Candidatus Scatonaster coprocaballi]